MEVNNMNKHTIVASILVLGLMVGGAVSVSAYQGDPNVKGPNYTEERHTAMTKAFAEKNYQAWKNLMQGTGRATQVVNEKNFAKFAEAHALALQGKTDEAAKIRAELGLGLKNGSGKGQGFGRMNK